MIALAAFPLGVVLHNLFYGLASISAGIPALQKLMEFLHVFFFLAAVMAVGPAALAGLIGGVIRSWQGMNRLTLKNRSIRRFQEKYQVGDVKLRKLVNLAYRFNSGSRLIQGYEDTDLSFRIPVGRSVQVVGRWLYSLLQEDTVEAFAGIEFGRCCWRLRVLGRHLKTSAESDGNTSIMLQLELAGLGALGNQIDKLLERGIYGYQSY